MAYNWDWPEDDPKFQAFLRHGDEWVLPKAKESDMNVMILHGRPDAKLCLETGAMLLYDKPFIIVVPDHRTIIPINIKKVAAAIVVGDIADPLTYQSLQKAIKRVEKTDPRAWKDRPDMPWQKPAGEWDEPNSE